MSFFGINFGGGDPAVVASNSKSSFSQESDVGNLATSSSLLSQDEISLDAEREMTQDEVNKLVHNALRRARKATTPKRNESKSKNSSDPKVEDPVFNGGKDKSLINDTRPMLREQGKKPYQISESLEKIITVDSIDSQQQLHDLLSPTMDSALESERSFSTDKSINSSDSVLQKVEAEIELAKQAALTTNQKLREKENCDEDLDDLEWSPSDDLADILNDHLADDEEFNNILDVGEIETEHSKSSISIKEHCVVTPVQTQNISAIVQPLSSESRLVIKYIPEPSICEKNGSIMEDNFIANNSRNQFQEENASNMNINKKTDDNYCHPQFKESEIEQNMHEKQANDIESIEEIGFRMSEFKSKEKLKGVDGGAGVGSGDEDVSKLEESASFVKPMQTKSTENEVKLIKEGQSTILEALEISIEQVDQETLEKEGFLEQPVQSSSKRISSTDESSQENFHAELEISADDSQIEVQPSPERKDKKGKKPEMKAVMKSTIFPLNNEMQEIQLRQCKTDLSKGEKHIGELTTPSYDEYISRTRQLVSNVQSDSLIQLKPHSTNFIEMNSKATAVTSEDICKNKVAGDSLVKHYKGSRNDTNTPPPSMVYENDSIVDKKTRETKFSFYEVTDQSESVEKNNHPSQISTSFGSIGNSQEMKSTTAGENSLTKNIKSEDTGQDSGVEDTKSVKRMIWNECQEKSKAETQNGKGGAGSMSTIIVKEDCKMNVMNKTSNDTSQEESSDKENSPFVQRSSLNVGNTKANSSLVQQVDLNSGKVQFRHPYPYPPPLPKPRPSEEIISDNSLGIPENFTKWSRPSQDLEKLFSATCGESLHRRSNACGALKVLSQKKKNQLALVRTKGFLDSLTFAISAQIPSNRGKDIALDSRARGVSTLLNVTGPKDNRIIVGVHPGVLPALLKVLEEDNGEAQVQACATLALLAKTPSNREHMAKVSCLFDLLARALLGSTDEDTIGLEGESCDDFDEEEDEHSEGSKCHEKKDEESDLDATTDCENDAFSTNVSNSSYSAGDDDTQNSENSDGVDTLDEHDTVSLDASSSISSARVVLKLHTKQRSIRKQKDAMHDEFLRRARVNACAALLHLSKHCAILEKMAQNVSVVESLVKVSREFENPIHTKCIEMLCNLTKFPSNQHILARNNALIDTLVMCGKSKTVDDRLWSMRTFQNLATDAGSKVILANSRILTLLSICSMREEGEQMAAVAALYNLSTEPGAVVPLTNTRNVVATLVHLTHNGSIQKEVRLLACDILATIGLWLQTLAASGTVPPGVPKLLLPSHKTLGWKRWEK
mmetsp:Transcript_39492/g.43688  ORF Transcript_39492/g.43688 Transcript_39492/m.43688 type:complete len:1297 (+) Transcript_39492:49-3939(+)|eukprot:CAMPEP_0194172860 /NCGR_PEP_ID=MMETSP0154-20130528/7264_1 /TAXON_ID=1049557 /ORGANISM="Thalassiothrix antarctica, Strain L6-D1" /LENGTH=1296 /DNA_ID=CAMNT_0038885679 /DNA_START=29 /DNA_END=3919 /DNA_ORIENTATION=-